MIVIEFTGELGLSQALKEAERKCPMCTTSDLFVRSIEKTSTPGVFRLKISIRQN